MEKMNLSIALEDQCPEIDVIQPMAVERRQRSRNCFPNTITVKKRLASGKYKTMRFRNRDISKDGAFILTENLSFFDLGDEVEVVVDYGNGDGKKKYFAGKAVVIHSEAIFEKGSVKTQAGYGMKFISGK